MANKNSLKAKALKTIFNTNFILPGPIVGRDFFISPTNPSAKVVMNDAKFLQLLPKAIKTLIPDSSMIDVVCGVETSGIPVAALVAYALKKPFAYVRKKPKPYGRGLPIQGDVSGKRVLVVDDLIFYGETKDDALTKIRQAGGNVVGMFVIFTMDPQSQQWAERNGITLLRLFDRIEIYREAVKRGIISRQLFDLEQEIYHRRDFMHWHTDLAFWQRYIELTKTDPLFQRS